MIFNVVGGGGKLPTPEEIGALSMERLWENASPGSAFAAQTVSLDLSEYDGVVIVYIHYTNYYAERSMFVGKGQIGCLQSIFGASQLTGHMQVAIRTVSISADAVTFSNGSVSTSGGAMESNTSVCVPRVIYGIKGVSA